MFIVLLLMFESVIYGHSLSVSVPLLEGLYMYIYMKEINHIRKIADQKMISPTFRWGTNKHFEKEKKKWTTGRYSRITNATSVKKGR